MEDYLPKVDEFQESMISLVQQYLKEHGFEDTLSAFEAESGIKFSPSRVSMGSKLETIVNEYQELERLNNLHIDSSKSTETKADDSLLEKGDGNYPKAMWKNLDSIHAANILSISFSFDPELKVVATGSVDKTVKLTNYETSQQIASFAPHNGAVLSVDYNPKYHHLLLSSSMAGSHCVIDTKAQKVLQTFNDHSKYVVSVRWAPDGLTFASASYDHTVNIYRADSEEGPWTLKETFPFNSNPESLCFIQPHTLVIAVREDNYLYYIDLNTFTKTKFNMNATLDDHVSFSAMSVAVGINNEYVLVATDRNRIIMYKEGISTPVRNFWGSVNDLYSQPVACFHPSGKYVYSTSQDHKIYCWEVATQSIVSKLEGHSSTIRDLRYHPNEAQLMGTCGFDKTVKLWTNS